MNSNAENLDPCPASPSLDGLKTFIKWRLPGLCALPRTTSADAGYALPDSSLILLRDVIGELGVREVFEFGSGRSTKLFLDCGCRVTSVEESEAWLRRTMMSVSWELRTRLRAVRRPLQTVFEDGSPFLGWRLNRELRQALEAAELVLVDSPAYPPFREHALIMTLRRNTRGLVVLDDANVPTVDRFCHRLAWANQLAAHCTRMDHGLYFFAPPAPGQSLVIARSLLETLKAWRRYLMGARFCIKPRPGAVPT